MINSLTIQNFKSIKTIDLPLKNLSVLTGFNSSGKSSVIQSIRMIDSAIANSSPYLTGHGGYKELRSDLAAIDSDILITLLSKKERCELKMAANSWEVTEGIILPEIEYIGADRFGPQVSLPIMDDANSKFTIGDRGQYTVDYFTLLENVLVPEGMRHPNARDVHTLAHQITPWMHEISPHIEIKFDKITKHDVSHVEINGYRSTNTGFGISYTLPVVLCLLAMTARESTVDIEGFLGETWFQNNKKKAPILLLENPEAHLHPRGQTMLGQLIARASQCGVQIIVETHSDHVIDGIRIEIKKGDLDSLKASFLYFDRNSSGETSFQEILCNSNGKLDKWPHGFFDQTLLNLKQLSV